MERLWIALSGKKLADAIKPDVNALVEKAGAICRECHAALDAAGALRAKTLETNHVTGSAASNLTALEKVLEAFDRQEIRIHQLVAELQNAEHALFDRIDGLAGIYRLSAAEKARLMEDIGAIRQPAMELHARFLQDFMSLERLWQQWSPAERVGAHQETTPRLRRA